MCIVIMERECVSRDRRDRRVKEESQNKGNKKGATTFQGKGKQLQTKTSKEKLQNVGKRMSLLTCLMQKKVKREQQNKKES